MRRDALRIYLVRLLRASLPAGALVLGGCPLIGCPLEEGVRTFPIVADGGVGDGGGANAGGDCKDACYDQLRAAGKGGVFVVDCHNATGDGGGPELVCHYTIPCTGRRPAALASSGAIQAADAVGAHLAAAAALEAASVPAFRHLRDDLVEHGAPAHLVRAADRAARDEIRHARVMARLARRHGAVASRPVVGPRVHRSLEAIAVENAVEGCVRETWGALVAGWQAERAADPAIRAALSRIAVDEAGHAELAWAVDAWMASGLEAVGRARVAAARHLAAEALDEELRAEPPEPLVAVAGLPSADQARRLAATLHHDLWCGEASPGRARRPT